MAPADLKMESSSRLRRARTAKGIRDLDREALRRRQAHDLLAPRSDDDDSDDDDSRRGRPNRPGGRRFPDSPDFRDSPKFPKGPPAETSLAAPPQGPPQQEKTLPPPPAQQTQAPSDPGQGNQGPPSPPQQTQPPSAPGQENPGTPPPPPASSKTKAPNPPVSTVPLPAPPPRAPPAATTGAQASSSPESSPPPIVQNPADVTPSKGPNPPVSTVPLPGAPTTSSSSLVISVTPTPSAGAPQGTGSRGSPFPETAIAIETGTSASATRGAAQSQVTSGTATRGLLLPSSIGSAIPAPPDATGSVAPVESSAAVGDGGAGLHAGIAVGSVAGTAFVSALAFYMYKKYRRRVEYLDTPYITDSGSSGGAGTGATVAVTTGAGAGVAAARASPSAPNGAAVDPKTNSQMINDMFQAVYDAENGQAGMYGGADGNSMAGGQYAVDEKMQVQEFQSQEQGGRGTVASWLRGTKTPTSPTRSSWHSRFTAPSWAVRSSTGSTVRASAAFPPGFQPATPPPVPAIPVEGEYQNSYNNNVGGEVNSEAVNAGASSNSNKINPGMVSRWSESTRPPPSPKTVRQSEAMSNSSLYSMYQQNPPSTYSQAPPVPSTSSQYQSYYSPIGPGSRRPSESLPHLDTTGAAGTVITSANKETMDFEVSPLSPESEASTRRPTIASPINDLQETLDKYVASQNAWIGQKQ